MNINNVSEEEKVMATAIALELIGEEEFEIEVNEYGEMDKNGVEIYTENRFNLIDTTGANLGDIENDSFFSLGEIIDRLERYHYDYFINGYLERLNSEVVPADDYDRKILLIINSDFCANALLSVTASDFEELHKEVLSRKVKDITPYLDYFINKDIAYKISCANSGHCLVEYEGKLYQSPYGEYDTDEDFIEYVKKAAPNDLPGSRYGIYQVYNDYSEFVKDNFYGILNDIDDIGLTEDGSWNFYLSMDELMFCGISKKDIDKELEKEHCLDVLSNMKYYDVCYFIPNQDITTSIVVRATNIDIAISYIKETQKYKLSSVKELPLTKIEEYKRKGMPVVTVSDEVDVIFDGFNDAFFVDKFNHNINLSVKVGLALTKFASKAVIDTICIDNPRYNSYILNNEEQLKRKAITFCRCNNCTCLVADDNGEWKCSEAGCSCIDVEKCPEGLF